MLARLTDAKICQATRGARVGRSDFLLPAPTTRRYCRRVKWLWARARNRHRAWLILLACRSVLPLSCEHSEGSITRKGLDLRFTGTCPEVSGMTCPSHIITGMKGGSSACGRTDRSMPCDLRFEMIKQKRRCRRRSYRRSGSKTNHARPRSRREPSF